MSKARLIAIRDQIIEGQVRQVTEEIGIITGIPGEPGFTQQYHQLVEDRCGGVGPQRIILIDVES